MAAALIAAGVWLFLWPEKLMPKADTRASEQLAPLYRARGIRVPLPRNKEHEGYSRVLLVAGMNDSGTAELKAATLGTAWGREQQPELAAFFGWAKIYLGTSDERARQAMEAKGETLAVQRRAAMGDLVRNDPKSALAAAVPVTVRRQLPAKVQCHLETRVSAPGTLSVQAVVPDGQQSVLQPIFRTAMVNDREYRAHVYGNRSRHRTRVGIHLQGIAVGRDLAVLESPGRVLEPGEAFLTDQTKDRQCSICNTSATKPIAIEKGGKVRWQCSSEHASQALANTSKTVNNRRGILSMADRSRTVGDFSVTDRPRMAWTHGAKRVLLIRVDFADIAGVPVSNGRYVTPDYAHRLFHRIDKFFQRASYGRTSVLLEKDSITPVLRMPKSAMFYARGGLNDTLHLHARQAATAAGFAVDGYDRVGVVFSSLKWYGGTQMDYGGLANVEGRNFWVNGRLEFGSMAHELGHTYGVHHANLHRSTTRSPIGPGTIVEYGDIFDIMGNTNLATEHHDFNPWFKYLMHWLPEESVLTATGPGVYRIYRYDEASISLDLPLVLKVRRRGEASDYWIGYRRAFPQLSRAAYVTWGFEENRDSVLLDMRTPWMNPTDAGLKVGATFHDQAAAVTLHPQAVGTDDTGRAYLDVEVKMVEAPVITGQPREHQKIEPGSVLRLSVHVRSKSTLRHEWRRDGKLLKDDGRVVGASSAELVVINISEDDAGRYTAHLLYEGGEVASRAALVDVGSTSVEMRIDWLRRLGGAAEGASLVRDLVTDSVGGLLLAGDFSGNLNLGTNTWSAGGKADMFVARYDQQGELQWAKTMGGPGGESATAVTVDAAGNGYVAGWFFDKAEFGRHVLSRPGRYSAFVAKVDATGQWQWARAIAEEGECMVSSVVLLPNNDLVVGGAFQGVLRLGPLALASQGGSDAFVLRLNSSGHVQWARSMGGGGEDLAAALAVDRRGQLVVAGSYTGNGTFGSHRLSALGDTDVFVARWTASGQMTWLTSEGGRGADFVSSLAATDDGGWLLAGDFEGVATLGQVNHQSRGATDVFLVRYLKDGVPAWSRTLGSTGPDIGGHVALARNGVVYLAASTGGRVNMGEHSLVGRGRMDVCLAAYALDGTLLGGRTWGGDQDDLSAGLTVDEQGKVYLSGSASGRARFDTFTLDAQGPSMGFLMGIHTR